MRIRVKYLANVRDITGKEYEDVELSGPTVKDLVDYLIQEYDIFNRGLQIMILVNGRSVWDNYEKVVLEEDDSVVVVPPIGGGVAEVNERCTACGICVKECPKKAIKLDDIAIVSISKCVSCGVCEKVCPREAISVKPSSGAVCTSCPVNCIIPEGERGACLRYKNEKGQIVLSRGITAIKGRKIPLLTGVGAGNTQPCFVPAPVIVEDDIDGTDTVTVVSATPLSFSHLRLKVDTDEYIGQEGTAVYRDGKKIGMVITEEYGSKMIDIGGVNVLQGKNGVTAARTIVDIANGREVELRVGKARVRVKTGDPPVINGKTIRKMRLGCGSAVIAMFAEKFMRVADEVIVLDSHITGLLTEHSAGKYLGLKYSGIVPHGVKSTDGRYFGDHGDGIGGTSVRDPEDAIRSIDFSIARDGMRIMITDTTGENLHMLKLEGHSLKEIEPGEDAENLVKEISRNCEKSRVSALYFGGVGGSARTGVARYPLRVTEAVHRGDITITVGGARATVMPGGGINFFVNVEEVAGKDPFTYVPTPATVAPMEYTMTEEVYRSIGGYMDRIVSFSEFIKKHDIEWVP